MAISEMVSSSSLQDAASVARDRIHDVVQAIGERNNLKDGIDALIRTMFAPCAGVTSDFGEIGGVPRDEIGGLDPVVQTTRTSSAEARLQNGPLSKEWIPFEVAARTRSDLSKDESDTKPRTMLGSLSLTPSLKDSEVKGETPNRPLKPLEEKQARSRAKLRQLGAQHQLASGVYGDTLAQKARPVSPEKPREDETPDLVDFDDGISALSSHTLEEMERRRHGDCVRVTHSDFAKPESIKENDQESEFENIFGNPFPVHDGNTSYKHNTSSAEWMEMLVTNGADRGAVVKKVSKTIMDPFDLGRGQSTHTKSTSLTEDTREFERVWKADEARYWVAVANEEKGQSNKSRRPTGRPSVEERARRLRDLSRSRSRSDGTGSSGKPFLPNLDTNHHPHDTVPVYASDVVSKPKRSKSRSRKSRSFVLGSFATESRGNNPSFGPNSFSTLDFGEI